jgi:hypothetical protein
MDKSRFLEAIRNGSVDPFFSSLYHKDSPSAPPAPDYAGAAQAQGAANVETARIQGRMNNPNVYTPYGSQTVTWGNQQPQWTDQQQQERTRVNNFYGRSTPDVSEGPLTIIGYEEGPNADSQKPIYGRPSSGGQQQSQSYQPSYDGMDDQPTITQTLAPAQQQLLDSQNRISNNLAGVAERGLNRVSEGMNTSFDMSQINPLQTNAGVNPNYTSNVITDPQARQHAEDMSYRAATSRLDPQWQQRNSMQDTQLRNQGLVPGGEAYDAAKRDQGYQQNDAYLQAQANAVNQGLANQQSQFGMNLQNAQLGNSVGQQQFQQGLANAQFGNQTAQQQIQQQAWLRSLPLNELNSLRTGSQVQNPQFQGYQGSNIAQTPVMQGAQAQGAWDQNMYNQQVGSANAFNQGLFQLGAAAAGKFSDRRLKSNIVRVGTHPLGIGIYEYDIFGHRTQGVMADEVESVMPSAVTVAGGGYKMVDYGKL